MGPLWGLKNDSPIKLKEVCLGFKLNRFSKLYRLNWVSYKGRIKFETLKCNTLTDITNNHILDYLPKINYYTIHDCFTYTSVELLHPSIISFFITSKEKVFNVTSVEKFIATLSEGPFSFSLLLRQHFGAVKLLARLWRHRSSENLAIHIMDYTINQWHLTHSQNRYIS